MMVTPVGKSAHDGAEAFGVDGLHVQVTAARTFGTERRRGSVCKGYFRIM
jgi:hypothetical protein